MDDEEIIDLGTTSGDSLLDSVSDSPDDPAPVQVVSVDELVERLTSSSEGEEEPEETEPSLSEQYYTAALEDTSSTDTVELLREIRTELLTVREEIAPHDLMTTEFSDYTVTEGLLLLALLYGVVSACVKMLKGGFSWLSW